MQVKIISVHNQGSYESEYVLLKVSEDCDIGKYQLCDTTYTSDGQVSNKLRNTYWFPDRLVKKGDLVSLWTKTGKNTTDKNDSGTPIHRFYWNLAKPVWNNDGDCAVLQHVPSWQHFKAKGK